VLKRPLVVEKERINF